MHRFRQTLLAIEPLLHLKQPEARERFMIEPAYAVVCGEARQAGAHALQSRFKIARVEVCCGDQEVIAVMELVFRQQAALQAVDQSQDFSVGHFKLQGKEKRPPVQSDGRVSVFTFRVTGSGVKVKTIKNCENLFELMRVALHTQVILRSGPALCDRPSFIKNFNDRCNASQSVSAESRAFALRVKKTLRLISSRVPNMCDATKNINHI